MKKNASQQLQNKIEVAHGQEKLSNHNMLKICLSFPGIVQDFS